MKTWYEFAEENNMLNTTVVEESININDVFKSTVKDGVWENDGHKYMFNEELGAWEEIIDTDDYEDDECAYYIANHVEKVKKQFADSCIKEEVVEYYEKWCEKHECEFTDDAEELLDIIYEMHKTEREAAEAKAKEESDRRWDFAREMHIPFFDFLTDEHNGYYFSDVAPYEIKDEAISKYTPNENGLYEVDVDDMKCSDIEVSRDVAVARKKLCIENGLDVLDREIWIAVKREAIIEQYSDEDENIDAIIDEIESSDAEAAENAYFEQEEANEQYEDEMLSKYIIAVEFDWDSAYLDGKKETAYVNVLTMNSDTWTSKIAEIELKADPDNLDELIERMYCIAAESGYELLNDYDCYFNCYIHQNGGDDEND